MASFCALFLFFSKNFVYLQSLSAPFGYEAHRVELSLWVGRYILKGVTDALFLGLETTTFDKQTKTNADVTATGCVIASP